MAMGLTEQVAQFVGIPAMYAKQLLDICRHKQLAKGEFFIAAGQYPKKMAIVLSGLFRYLYVDDEGNEYTKAFMPEGSFLSSYSAMILNERSYYSIEALENAEILEFSYENWQILKDSDVVWKDLLIGLLEQGYGAKERRERELLLLDAETRYRNFCKERPTLIARVKQHQIASFLGIKPESLSRLKKNMTDLT